MKTKVLIDQMYMTRDFTHLAELYINDSNLLRELVEVATSNMSHPYPEYASWLLVHISQKNQSVLESYQPQMIDRILVSENQSVLRNLVNTTNNLSLSQYKESEFLDRLLHFITDDSNKVALFVYAIYKLIQFTNKYPEIKSEIEGIITLKESQELRPALRIGIRNYRLKTKHLN